MKKAFTERKLTVLKVAYEEYKKLTAQYAGPAVIETFGEPGFDPVNKPESLALNEKQEKLSLTYSNDAAQVVNQYIPGEETSFTTVSYTHLSASKGGTSTEQWKKSYISDAVSRLESAKSYLSDHQIAVRDIYVVWCQGETDGDYQVTKEIYKKNTQELMEQLSLIHISRRLQLDL